MAIYQKIIGSGFEKLPLRKLIIFSIILNAAMILIGLFSNFILPPEIPVYFGLPQTSEQLAPRILIILPFILGLIISLTNCLIAIKISNNYLKKALGFATFSISILAFIASIKIIFLVGLF